MELAVLRWILAYLMLLSAMPAPAQAQSALAERRAVALQWDGVAGPIPGVLDTAPDGSGTLRFQMIEPDGRCIGTISVIDSQRNGSWALACGDGMAASGRYRRPDLQSLGEGKGTDTRGRAVSFTVGASLMPPPEAKTSETRKAAPVQATARAAPWATPSREQVPSTADALNEAELRKARERTSEPEPAATDTATAAAPSTLPPAPAKQVGGEESCAMGGLGLDFGLSVFAANLSCRVLTGLGEQAALAPLYGVDRAKRAEILRTCVERYKEQPEATGAPEAELRRRCEVIGASFPLMAYLGGFPTATERAQAVDACVADGDANAAEGQRLALRARCADQVSERIVAARDATRNTVELPSRPPPIGEPTPRKPEPRRAKPAP